VWRHHSHFAYKTRANEALKYAVSPLFFLCTLILSAKRRSRCSKTVLVNLVMRASVEQKNNRSQLSQTRGAHNTRYICMHVWCVCFCHCVHYTHEEIMCVLGMESDDDDCALSWCKLHWNVWKQSFIISHIAWVSVSKAAARDAAIQISPIWIFVIPVGALKFMSLNPNRCSL